MRRSRFLSGLGAAAWAIPARAYAAPPRSPWVIWLNRLDGGGGARVPLTLDGRTLWLPGYNAACFALRDAHVDPALGVRQISVITLQVLCEVQYSLAVEGLSAPIIVHSGYRSPQTNARTEGAARNSFHLRGMAVDFDIPGVPLNTLAEVVRLSSGTGGLGYYPRGDSGWIHVDTGWRREWSG